MFKIDSTGAAAALPAPAVAGLVSGYFTEGNAETATPATVVSADWLNAVQEEIIAVLTQAGIAPDKTVRTQLRDAILAIGNTGGGGTLSKTSANSPFTQTTSQRSFKWNTAGGACVHNLPAAASMDGAEVTIVKTNAAGSTLTITPNGAETINAETTLPMTQQWDNVVLKSIGSGWIVI
jgi:hypothetical protein